MSTLIEPSRVSRIQDELKTLSRQELRLVEITARELQQNLDVPEHQENKDTDNNLDFDKDGWLHPKPGAAQHFIELCQKHWKNYKNYNGEDYDQLKIERILGEQQNDSDID
jgi:hypothetical protein